MPFGRRRNRIDRSLRERGVPPEWPLAASGCPRSRASVASTAKDMRRTPLATASPSSEQLSASQRQAAAAAAFSPAASCVAAACVALPATKVPALP